MAMKFEDFLKRGFDRPLPEPPPSEIRDRIAKDRGAADPADLALARGTAWPVRFFRSHPRILALSSVAAILVLGFIGLLILAQDALPGDPLYALKRTYESARLSLAPASFDLRSEIAQERTEELQRLDRDSQLDISRARMLIREINDHLVYLHERYPDERLERCSEEMFDRVIQIIEGHDFIELDQNFPMPLFFRRHIGIQRAFVSLAVIESRPSLWGEGEFVYVMIDGQVFKVHAKTMKLMRESK
jgi:hypothetical protein